MVGAVRCSSCASSSCPVQAGEGVGAELEVSQVDERRGGVSSAGTGAKARAGSGTGPEYRKHGGFAGCAVLKLRRFPVFVLFTSS